MQREADNERWMRRAVTLARAQLGRTGDNPAVGCVIVRDGAVVGEAATGDGGRPHAEEAALALAGDRSKGAVAYVTLEPCAERSSGDAACAERLAVAGVAHVVVACEDRSVMADGRGMRRLQDAGIAYDLGLLNEEAAPLYAAYAPRRNR